MTTRLKRKLADLGVDTSSRRANENFCLIGTPLPPLEKKDTNEFVPVWKQDVRDEKGRRRLHGAFTGGFSAGYFNTVGSKEGWTPSTFVSSRNDRMKKKVYRPEDFMDEEDLQELKDSRTLVSNVEAMDLSGATQTELARHAGEDFESDPMRGALVAALLPAPKDSAGAQVLRKMGWKPGQGIGPRISYRQRKLEDMKATLRKPLTLADVVITEEEEEAAKHTYPRRDTAVPVFERKDNRYGLGYEANIVTLNESLGREKKQTENGPTLSAGFGLGALNEAEDDDIDVYDSGYNPGKSRVAFDHAEPDNDTFTLAQKQPKVEKKVTRPSATAANFSSGLPVLPGFVLDDSSVSQDQWFPGLEIPEGWKPDPRRVWNSDPNKENIRARAEKLKEPVSHHKWKTGISAEERGSLLGETPLSTEPRSVFEYMSQKDRDRIQNIAAGLAQGPQPLGPTDIRIPHTDPQVAQAALQGFQPFLSDPVKHERYTAYLLSQVDPNATTPTALKPLPTQKNEEFNKELEDYAKAATLFKPMTGAMAGRFTSAAVVEHGPKVHEGLHTPSAEELERHEAEEIKRQEEKLTPLQNAAKLGMYGPMTREVKPWQPARLLCKRFGVKEPELQPDADLSSSAKAPAEKDWQEQAGVPVPAKEEPSASRTMRDLSNVGLGEDETQGADTLTYQRPSMDIFKAIFASDEESGDEDTKEELEEEETGEKNDVTAKFFPEDTKEANEIKDEGPVDMGTFKPTFIPRDRKSKSSKDQDKEKRKDKDKDRDGRMDEDGKEKKERKDKEKKRKDRKSLVSFEVDEEGGGLSFTPKPSKSKNKEKDKDRPKKKRKVENERHENGNEDDDMMRESKEPAMADSVTKITDNLQQPPLTSIPNADSASVKGRKRAIDFM